MESETGASSEPLTPEEIAFRYIDELPWPPYPFQEQAIFSWFEAEDGILICAPTGTGKTVIAETALYEALHTGRRAYYTTPLIALTEQKFHELQDSAERWGFAREDVGLVTGNRRVNPDAPILVVVAEILLNRLLSPEEFSFDDVSAVVMDEFHSFNDPERGIVWELSLGMLPKSTRVLLISATVGNAPEFVVWLNQQHNRTLRLLQSDERRVPLTFRWVMDELLAEQLEIMADNEDESARYTPALVFCFNRSECWSVAEQLKGRRLLASGQQKQLQQEIDQLDWSVGAGGKLKQILIRGVGIHHAGLLPRYRRAVESLFQKKLLSVCVCTETLAAGINLPARSVVMTSLLKGPRGRMTVIDASSAHQMFGRAGRPQFDDQGYVFAVAHEDDVKLHRWQEKYDQIPEDTKDPGLRRARKNLKKKMPRRRAGQQYWSEQQFEQLQSAPPARLASKGRFPWRLLAFLVRKSGAVIGLRSAIRKRLLDAREKELALDNLKRMLITMDAAGLLTLTPPPPHRQRAEQQRAEQQRAEQQRQPGVTAEAADTADAVRSAAEDGGPEAADDATTEMAFGSVLAGNEGVELNVEDVQDGRSVTTSVWGTGLEMEDTGLGDVVDFSQATGDEDPDFGCGVFAEEADAEAAGADATAATDSPDASVADEADATSAADSVPKATASADVADDGNAAGAPGLLGQLIREARDSGGVASSSEPVVKDRSSGGGGGKAEAEPVDASWRDYEPEYAVARPQLDLMFAFRSVNPIYALFLAEQFHRASYEERLQLMEGALNMPMSVARSVRVPFPDKLPHGPLATEFLDAELLTRGLVTQDELRGYRDEVLERNIPPLKLADKVHLLFRSDYPGISDARTTAVWCVGDLLQFGGDFNKFVRARDLTKQEGIIFRHCLRMILLCGEYAQIVPPGIPGERWRADLAELAALLTDSCRAVDPSSTDETLSELSDRRVDPGQLVL